ncbi:MAG: aminotransferase class V-fold PLP-dependent enzyme [bacterium]|nr:aminotransferase class V-fold PLP-dependent enzyme [bacterium]
MKHDLFLLELGIRFLNHGSFGACPREVFRTYQTWQEKLEQRPVEFLGRKSSDLLQTARKDVAAYLGTSYENLVFVTNSTTGVNTVSRSLDLQPGDEILTTDHEYGACDNAWEFVCKSSGAIYSKVHIPFPFPPDEGFVEYFFKHVTPRTRVIYLSHITSCTALIFPLAGICKKAREKGILTVIDGAHAPGHIPLNLDEVGADFYTGNFHKWLCAPKGSAFLYARPEVQDALHGLVISWGYSSSIEGHTSFDAYTGSSVLERRHQWQGTRDISAFLTVPAAIEFQAKHDWETVRRECRALAARTHERINRLTGLPPVAPQSAFGQMVAIPLPDCDPEELKARLYHHYKIEVPITGFSGKHFVRVSFQAYNTPDDADALIDALQEIFQL